MAYTSPGAAPAIDWLARLERFDVVGSTNDVVAGWLHDGTPEVCVAIADEQLAGRGRSGRAWSAPSGASLLLSAGFRPTWLAPTHAWRLAAIVSLAMASAAESIAGLASGTVRLKWPNDLVVRDAPGGSAEGSADGAGTLARKLAGVLGETHGLGTDDPQAVIGIGINVNWPRATFPAEFAAEMTSLSESAGRSVGRQALSSAFIDRLQPFVDELRDGGFAAEEWRARQLTNGMVVRLERPDGSAEQLRALDVDPESGALIVAPLLGEGQPRAVTVGEIRHLRLGGTGSIDG